MSQVKLSKSQLAVLDAMIAVAQEKGHTSIGSASPDCFIDCVLTVAQTLTPAVVAVAGGSAAALHSTPISIAKLIEIRKAH